MGYILSITANICATSVAAMAGSAQKIAQPQNKIKIISKGAETNTDEGFHMAPCDDQTQPGHNEDSVRLHINRNTF